MLPARKFALFICLLLIGTGSMAQETHFYKSNVIGVDLIQTAINEINFSLEHLFSNRRSMVLSTGLVYVNKPLEKMADEWTNSHVFSEHGFTLRLGYKLYRKPRERSRWNAYIEPMLVYKYLYFNNQWFDDDKARIYQHRFRHKFGFDFLWGKVLAINQSVSMDFYLGAGLRATSVARTDLLKQEISGLSDTLVLHRGVDQSFYMRPALTAGIKFRFAL